MGSLGFGLLSHISTIETNRNPNQNGSSCPVFRPFTVRCGLRGAGTRKTLWRSAVMSTEAIQAVQALKIAKKASTEGKLEEVFRSRISRLIKADLIAVLAELQRQNHWELTLQLFEFIRKEEWYQADVSLYCDMIYMAGKNKFIEVAERLFYEISIEGLKPISRVYTEMIGAYLKVDMLDKAMDMYNSMKESGFAPDELTFTILIKNLQKAGRHDLTSMLKCDCPYGWCRFSLGGYCIFWSYPEDFLECPEKFLEEVERNYPKRRPLKLV